MSKEKKKRNGSCFWLRRRHFTHACTNWPSKCQPKGKRRKKEELHHVDWNPSVRPTVLFYPVLSRSVPSRPPLTVWRPSASGTGGHWRLAATATELPPPSTYPTGYSGTWRRRTFWNVVHSFSSSSSFFFFLQPMALKCFFLMCVERGSWEREGEKTLYYIGARNEMGIFHLLV